MRATPFNILDQRQYILLKFSNLCYLNNSKVVSKLIRKRPTSKLLHILILIRLRTFVSEPYRSK